jgi:hypothetical protein
MKSRRTRTLLGCGLLGAALTVMSSCDRGLEALNTDRTRLTSVEPVMQLNNAIVNSPANLTMLQCETSIVKQHMRIFTGEGACGNFNVDARGQSNNNWNNGYQTRLRNLRDAVQNSEGTPAQQNLHNMARIFAAYTFMRITDSYGDVPYREAGFGHRGGNVFPEYDSQEFIYTSPQGILEEIKNATAALNPALARPTNDLLYGGNIDQWRRFGNSLLLRAALRLTKVRPDLAQQYVQAAINGPGGLMQSNADNAVVRHSSEFRNQPGNSLNGGQSHFNYLVHDFVDHLQRNNDPRLGAIAVRYPNATSAATQTPAGADRNPANQIGIPMGFDNTTIVPVASAQGLRSFFAYSQPDRQRIMDPQAPSFLLTYGQTQLLLADAITRGWATGNAATHYQNGIRAHMQQISTSYNNTTIPQSAIDAYVAANPLLPGTALEQINTEYWIASFLIADESWANFRRSCFPRLTPNPRQDDLGPGERFMRRFGYPDAEQSLNPNVVNGVSPDRIDTRVWWDVRVNEFC